MGSKSAKEEIKEEIPRCVRFKRHFNFDPPIQYANMGFFYHCPSEVFLLISTYLEIPDIMRLTFANKGVSFLPFPILIFVFFLHYLESLLI